FFFSHLNLQTALRGSRTLEGHLPFCRFIWCVVLQRQDGLMQRSIREVNTSSRWCVLWDLDEDTHYSVQVTLSLSLSHTHTHVSHGDCFVKCSSSALRVSTDEPAMEGLGMTTHLQTGELLIITTVLLLWAAVIALFCRQYDIIKDNDSNGAKEKAKRPLVRSSSSYYNASAGSSPLYHNGAVRSSRVSHNILVFFYNSCLFWMTESFCVL
uniref:Fibronectin type III domain containing 4b n=1 Tax=Nothobranchius furzeri TaxID=105023 RepID=A0A8C6LTQ5_NOTFU